MAHRMLQTTLIGILRKQGLYVHSRLTVWPRSRAGFCLLKSCWRECGVGVESRKDQENTIESLGRVNAPFYPSCWVFHSIVNHSHLHFEHCAAGDIFSSTNAVDRCYISLFYVSKQTCEYGIVCICLRTIVALVHPELYFKRLNTYTSTKIAI